MIVETKTTLEQYAAVGVNKAPEGVCVHFQMAAGFCISFLFITLALSYISILASEMP